MPCEMRHGGAKRADDSIGHMPLVPALTRIIRTLVAARVVAIRTLVAVSVVALLATNVHAQSKPTADTASGYAQRDEVRQFIATMVADHDFDATKLSRLFAQAQDRKSVV